MRNPHLRTTLSRKFGRPADGVAGGFDDSLGRLLPVSRFKIRHCRRERQPKNRCYGGACGDYGNLIGRNSASDGRACMGMSIYLYWLDSERLISFR
jgi:hypothetical protein